jgi:hypothetical protein
MPVVAAKQGLVAIRRVCYGQLMATLAQYSATLHHAAAVERPAPGRGSRWFGIALYAGTALLVAFAALQSA